MNSATYKPTVHAILGAHPVGNLIESMTSPSRPINDSENCPWKSPWFFSPHVAEKGRPGKHTENDGKSPKNMVNQLNYVDFIYCIVHQPFNM